MIYYKRLFSLLLISLFVFSCNNDPNKELLSSNQDVNTILNILNTPDNNTVIVVAHRGDWRNAPENSIQAIENCIKMGVDMVELDVRETKDGELILMHDSKLDRTTSGQGLVSDHTLKEIKELFLRRGHGQISHHKVPTLEEALLVSKDKILVNLDKCYDNFDKAFEIIQKTGTSKQVIIKAKVSVSQLQTDFGANLDKVLFMPIVDLNNSDAATIVADYQKTINPIAFEFVFKDETSPLLNQFKEIRAKGSRIWVNTLWESLNAGYEDDLAVDNPEEIYGWQINKGVNIIQTDRPALLLDYLRKNGLHQ